MRDLEAFSLPVYPVDVDNNEHLKKGDGEKGDGAGKVVKEGEPVVPWALGEKQGDDESHHTNNNWNTEETHRIEVHGTGWKKSIPSFYFPALRTWKPAPGHSRTVKHKHPLMDAPDSH